MLDQTQKEAKVLLEIRRLLEKGHGEILVKIAMNQIVDVYVTEHEKYPLEKLDKKYVAIVL
jgi:hypothetical protein